MADSVPKKQQIILPKNLVEEMRTSYLDYSMSVLVGRALPDVRDGLKPVHRRVLYTMYQTGLLHNKPYRKSANVVGNCMARYHPHGDASIYDTLVRMAQDFSMRYPLVDGQGNFGSVDGDNAAAMRYTEARLSKIAEELLADIEKETVEFVPNFDGSTQEPSVLPSKIPNLLINGSSGIAVGMATNIPPHNLGEVIDAITLKLRKPAASFEEVTERIKGPDFPTGGIIIGTNGIKDSYLTGRGNIKVRSRTSIENVKDRNRIIVTELPFQVNKAQLIEEMANLVREKRITGISDIRDESDRDGMRIVIELKRDASAEVVENQLFMHTKLEWSFGSIFVGLINNQPKTLGLIQLLDSFIDHRKDIVKKRTAYDLKKALEKMHILEGLLIALNRLDFVIERIRKSKDAQAAKEMLITQLKLTEIQAQAILDLRLQKLASLEQEKIREDHKETGKQIDELKSILSSEDKISSIIIKELEEIKQKYGNKRRTEIINSSEEEEIISEEDLVKDEQVIVTMTLAGYVKRLPIDSYRTQHRGGKGVIAAETREADAVSSAFIARTHDYILFFTNQGIVHWLKAFQMPEAGRQAMGKAIVNMLHLSDDEKVAALLPVNKFDEKSFLIFTTKKGIVKKTNLASFSRPRKGGIIAITLDEDDKLISVEITNGEKQVVLATKQGRAARFLETEIRPSGRGARGVRGIKLRQGDEVIGMVSVQEQDSLLTITTNGIGKRSLVNDYRLASRAGKGVINIRVTEKSGKVVSICPVKPEDEFIIISKEGQGIRVSSDDISVIGRNTQGVRIMKMSQNDHVVSVARIPSETPTKI
ncbi:MAG: DNA gyrase subunit A [Nanoarchaeota archaeon]